VNRGAAAPAIALLLSLSPSPARADGAPLTWDGFGTVGPFEMFTSATLLAATIPALYIAPSPVPWRGRDGFDEAWRNLAAAPTAARRSAADTASTALLAVSAADVAVDSMVVAGVRARGVAWQLTWIDLQAIGFTELLQTVVSHAASRERPYGRTCPAHPSPDNTDCTSDNRYQSFFSGHTSLAFTLAGLTCMHHAHLPLWGGGAPDALACALASGAAVTVGVLRTVADKHYLTDVLTGAGVGALSGFGIPLLYYGTGKVRPVADGRPAAVSATVVPSLTGAALVGRF